MSIEKIITKEVLSLTDKQSEGLITYLRLVSGATAETLSATDYFENSCVSIIDVQDTHGQNPAPKCDQGHDLRYLYTIEIRDRATERTTQRQLGVVCAEHVAELSDAEKLLVRGLGRWVNRSGYRELLKLLGRAKDAGRSGIESWLDYRRSSAYSKLIAMLEIVEGHESKVITTIRFKGGNLPRRRAAKLGLIRSAVAGARHLIVHELPVPEVVGARVVAAARRIQLSPVNSTEWLDMPTQQAFPFTRDSKRLTHLTP